MKYDCNLFCDLCVFLTRKPPYVWLSLRFLRHFYSFFVTLSYFCFVFYLRLIEFDSVSYELEYFVMKGVVVVHPDK